MPTQDKEWSVPGPFILSPPPASHVTPPPQFAWKQLLCRVRQLNTKTGPILRPLSFSGIACHHISSVCLEKLLCLREENMLTEHVA